jgi:hypothetical protein
VSDASQAPDGPEIESLLLLSESRSRPPDPALTGGATSKAED